MAVPIALVMTQEASGLSFPSKQAKLNTGKTESQWNGPQHINSSWNSAGQGGLRPVYIIASCYSEAIMPRGPSLLPSHPSPAQVLMCALIWFSCPQCSLMQRIGKHPHSGWYSLVFLTLGNEMRGYKREMVFIAGAVASEKCRAS